MRKILFVSLCFAVQLIQPAAAGLPGQRLVDLTHQFNEQTVYWPTSPSAFELTELSAGETPGGWYYSAYQFCTPEHGGTHLDAPAHFSANGRRVHEIPVDQLIGPGVVIDVSAQAAENTDYRLSVEDVAAFEARHGKIVPGTIVLLRTGWGKRWPDRREYLGDDTPGDASNLDFPSYGPDAARMLVERRGVALLGVDTASIDYGPSSDFMVHRIAAARNVAGLENLANLDQLPATGFTVLALPMKIEGGSGAPVRVVAIVPASP